MTSFSEILARAAADEMPDAQITVTGPTTLRVVRPGGHQDLDAALAEYESRGQSDQEVYLRCVRFLRGTSHGADRHESVPYDRIFPVVRTPALLHSDAGRYLAYREVGDSLNLHLVIDNPDGFVLVTNDQLRQWGTSFDALVGQAVDNLRRAGIEREIERDGDDGPQVMRVTGPYGYQTSWAADRESVDLLHTLEMTDRDGPPFRYTPEVVLFLPSRNDMYVVPQSLTDSLVWALENAWRVHGENPRPLAPCGFVYGEGGRLEVWQPPADHPAYELQSRAAAVFAKNEYTYQKDYFHADGGPGNDLREERGWWLLPIESWSKDQTTFTLASVFSGLVDDHQGAVLLPRADHIALTRIDDDGEAETIITPWAALESLLGPYKVVDELRPPRYVLPWFPTHDQWERLPASFEAPAQDDDGADDDPESDIPVRPAPLGSLLPVVWSSLAGSVHPGRFNVFAQLLTTFHCGQILADEGQGRRVADEIDMEAWREQGDRAALWERACDNLRATRNPETFGWWEVDGTHLLVAREPAGQGASWLATPDVLADVLTVRPQGQEPIQVPTVVFAPRADVLILVPADRNDLIATGMRVSRRLYEQGEGITPAPYTIDDDGDLVAWFPPSGHPLQYEAYRAYADGAVDQYGRQAALLTEHARDWLAVDKAVLAPLTGDEHGITYSRVLETDLEQADVLVPECDHVILVARDLRETKVAFYRFRRVMDLDKELCLSPYRVRVVLWPTEEELAELTDD